MQTRGTYRNVLVLNYQIYLFSYQGGFQIYSKHSLMESEPAKSFIWKASGKHSFKLLGLQSCSSLEHCGAVVCAPLHFSISNPVKGDSVTTQDKVPGQVQHWKDTTLLLYIPLQSSHRPVGIISLPLSLKPSSTALPNKTQTTPVPPLY